jgi:hypothetical protein
MLFIGSNNLVVIESDIVINTGINAILADKNYYFTEHNELRRIDSPDYCVKFIKKPRRMFSFNEYVAIEFYNNICVLDKDRNIILDYNFIVKTDDCDMIDIQTSKIKESTTIPGKQVVEVCINSQIFKYRTSAKIGWFLVSGKLILFFKNGDNFVLLIYGKSINHMEEFVSIYLNKPSTQFQITSYKSSNVPHCIWLKNENSVYRIDEVKKIKDNQYIIKLMSCMYFVNKDNISMI